MTRQQQFEALAAVISYPHDDYHQRATSAAAIADAAPAISIFAGSATAVSIVELQETWTSTFDLSPVCALDIGWHLFGETYDRGRMLVRMRAELQRHRIDENGELPDHLSNAVRLLGYMPADEAEDFASACIMPALAKMLAALPAENLFHSLLLAVRELIATHFPETAACVPSEPAFNIIREGAIV